MKTDELNLAGYLDKRDERKYSRLLLQRVFRATVTAVSGSAGLFQVQIQRTGEPNPDGAWYPCYLPGYYPRAGDVVDLIWRDEVTAYVFQVLTPGALVAGLYLLAPTVTLGAARTVVEWANIPQGFHSLLLECRVACDQTAQQFLAIQFNVLAGTGYYTQIQQGNGATSTSAFLRNAQASAYVGVCSGTNNLVYNAITIRIPGYSRATAQAFHSVCSRWDLAGPFIENYASAWTPSPSQAINDIQLSSALGNLGTNSQFTLYGEL